MTPHLFKTLPWGTEFSLHDLPGAERFCKIVPVFYTDLFPGYENPLLITNYCRVPNHHCLPDYLPWLDMATLVFLPENISEKTRKKLDKTP